MQSWAISRAASHLWSFCCSASCPFLLGRSYPEFSCTICMKWSLRAGFVLHLVENQDLWMYGLMYFFFELYRWRPLTQPGMLGEFLQGSLILSLGGLEFVCRHSRVRCIRVIGTEIVQYGPHAWQDELSGCCRANYDVAVEYMGLTVMMNATT
jgi:hypothetical protein